MYYVKWKMSKIHRVNQSISRVISESSTGGKWIARDASGPAGGAGLTYCAANVPAENECFDQLSDSIDRENDLCHVCFRGVGVPKVSTQTEQVGVGDKSNSRLKERMAKAARDLFS